MHHLDVFLCREKASDNILGTAVIGLAPGTHGTYNFYYRNNDGAYFEVAELTNLSVQETYKLEREQLHGLIQKRLPEEVQPTDWVLERTLNSSWDEASAAAPEVRIADWLHSHEYLFADDEGDKPLTPAE
ncbi:MAG: hypothetical protein Q4E12_00375 [Coriobacteriia bacterium]|nr:hypothetical protein [Coriobacteriia bacterium]